MQHARVTKRFGCPIGRTPITTLVYGHFRPSGQKEPEITSSPKSHQRQLGARQRQAATREGDWFCVAIGLCTKRSLHAFLDFPTEVPTRSGPKAAIECPAVVNSKFCFTSFRPNRDPRHTHFPQIRIRCLYCCCTISRAFISLN